MWAGLLTGLERGETELVLLCQEERRGRNGEEQARKGEVKGRGKGRHTESGCG